MVSSAKNTKIILPSDPYTTAPNMIMIVIIIIFSFLPSLMVQGQVIINGVDLVVAKDCIGNYTKIADAIAAVPKFSLKRYNIKITKGNYTENVIVKSDKTEITFIGEGIDQTIISGCRSYGGGFKTFDSATLGIDGDGFMAIDMTIENTAGAANEQAVALRSSSNSAFYRCKISGYQDTLYSHQKTQFYRECDIYGTVDFIFGDAKVILQNCGIYARLPLKGKNLITITAQGRIDPNNPTGTVIHNCIITASNDLRRNGSSLIKSYLGRPWFNYSRTIIMQSFIDNIIDPKGWLEWDKNSTNVGIIFYAEYQNRGPGASTKGRVKWKGYHIINKAMAENFTVRNFILGDKWLPSLGIPFFPDLI